MNARALSPEVRALEALLGQQRLLRLLKLAEHYELDGGSLMDTLSLLLYRLSDQGGSPPGNDPVSKLIRYKTEPVSVEEFMFSKFYLGKKGEVYPEVLKELVQINSGNYDEVVLTGGIGSGKTTLALYSQAYQLYLLSCLRQPHALFGLDSSSEIKIIFQSLNANLAKGLDYARFRSMVEASPYFQRHFMFNADLAAKLVFPNRIEVEPVSGAETASIGQNVIGGVIDEINFMAVVEKSKQAADGGEYNQALELYNTIARRRKSRFMRAGAMPGLLCMVSSKKTPGQFTDVKEAEAKTNPRIYVYDKRVWDIKPSSFCGQKFPVFIGDESRKPRILESSDQVPLKDQGLVDYIPVEFKDEFQGDITKALRDIAGKSTLAIHPFMPDADKVSANFGQRKSVLAQEKVDFVTVRPSVFPSRISRPDCPRWAHIDLAIKGDSAGVVIGHVPGFQSIKRTEFVEQLPICAIDCALEVAAPLNGEIDFGEIRRLLYKLREMGLPIRWVSLDSYQSYDTMQVLRGEGFISGLQSMDTTMIPYQVTKAALYDGRVPMDEHAKLKRELLTLERDFKKGKIDHNAHGSKDIADALAGVVYGLSVRREIWNQFGVQPTQAPSMIDFMYKKESEGV